MFLSDIGKKLKPILNKPWIFTSRMLIIIFSSIFRLKLWIALTDQFTHFSLRKAVEDSCANDNDPAKDWTVATLGGKPHWHISRIHAERVDYSVADSFLQFAITSVRAETPFNCLRRVFALPSNAAATFGIYGY